MLVSDFLRKAALAAFALLLSACAGVEGGGPAFAKSSTKAKAMAALQKPGVGTRNPFNAPLPKRVAHSIAVAGDSLSVGLASELERTLSAKPGLAFASLGKVSSGLARPDFFDWDRHMDQLTGKYRPDVVVVMLGANDNKRMTLKDGTLAHFGTPEWDRAYKERVRRILGIVRSHNPSATVFWLGAPVMADETLSRDLRHINALVRRVMSANRDCHFIETWDLFSAPGGGFAFSKPDVEGGATLRARDGVHLTQAGSAALAARCLDALDKRINWDASAPGASALTLKDA